MLFNNKWGNFLEMQYGFYRYALLADLLGRKVSVSIYLCRWAENQKFLKILFFSNTDIHRFLWLYSLIECLQVNPMYVAIFWFHSKLALHRKSKETCQPWTSYTYSFFLNMFFFSKKKKSFGYFQMNILTRLHPTRFSIATREFYIWEVLCQIKHPC